MPAYLARRDATYFTTLIAIVGLNKPHTTTPFASTLVQASVTTAIIILIPREL
jgi:hypothetical protein